LDHGSQYLSDHFANQVRFWGIKPCFAFVEQPRTNGVVERFNRTLKEQAICGKVLRNIEEVRRAAGKFVEDYNAQWRVSMSSANASKVIKKHPDLFAPGKSVKQGAVTPYNLTSEGKQAFAKILKGRRQEQ
jgi:hypothetical protein